MFKRNRFIVGHSSQWMLFLAIFSVISKLPTPRHGRVVKDLGNPDFMKHPELWLSEYNEYIV